MPVLRSGRDAALGLFTGPAGNPDPIEEYQAIGGEPPPVEVAALLALARQDTAAARKLLADARQRPEVLSGLETARTPRPSSSSATTRGTIETLRLV